MVNVDRRPPLTRDEAALGAAEEPLSEVASGRSRDS